MSEPLNPKLWRMVIEQAKRKFNVYPSPAASHWVHSEYEKHGGRFVKGKADVPKANRLKEDK